MSAIDHLGVCKDLLRQLIAIRSVSGNEKRAALLVHDFLDNELGMETELQEINDTSCNIIGRWRTENASRLIILGGHLDTVPPSELWETDPFTLTQDEDKLFGLGAVDMKGGIAAQLACLLRLKKEKIRLNTDIEFIGLADEEGLSSGAHRYVDSFDKKQLAGKSFFILGEPHFNNIVVGATGKILLRCNIKGQSCHAAKPENGINAIDCMSEFLVALNRKYSTEYMNGKSGSHCCLMVDSHYKSYGLNVPDRCTCLINKQLLPNENKESVVSDVEKIYHDTVGKGSLTIKPELPNYPAYQLPNGQEDLRLLLKLLHDKYSHRPELVVNQSVSDGNILYNWLKIPGVLFGPDGANLHSPGEYVSESSLGTYINELFDYICAF